MLTYALIVVLLVLAVCAFFMFRSSAGGMDYPDADKYTVGGATIPGSVNNLYVDWTAGKVNIEYHEGTGVIVSETANRDLSPDDQLRWWLDGDTLRVRYAKPGFRVSVNLEKKLTVSLPAGAVLKSADISSTSGDLYVPALSADEIRLNSTSGDIDAGVTARILAASSTSGDVTVLQDSDADTVAMSSTSGSLSFGTDGSVKTFRGDSTSGGVSLAVSGTAGDVRMRSTSGNIYPNLVFAEKAEISSTSGSVTGSVITFKDLKINTTSGSVQVRLGTDPGFTCKVSSASGDFTTDLSFTKDGNTYTFGDGSAACSIGTSSGDIWVGKPD